MKKYFSVLCLVLSLVMVGCSKKGTVSQQDQNTFSPPVDNLSWGMTSDQCKTALSLDKHPNDATCETDDTGMLKITLAKTQDSFGFPATVVLKFDPANDATWYPYHTDSLSSILLIYADGEPDQIKENLIKKFGNNGEDWSRAVSNESCTTWENPDNITSLSTSDQKNWSDFSTLYQENQDTSLDQATADTLNHVVLSINKDKTAASVEFYGDVVSIINNIRKLPT